MDANKALITNIFNNSTLIEVPFFQRSYVWKEELWARLLDDLEYVTKTGKQHFLGSIILKEGRKPNPGEMFSECKTIVDGQQRITTFVIFMKVLCLKKQQQIMFDFQFRIMGQNMALCHGKNDHDAFEKVMGMTEAKEVENPAPSSRIIEAFNFFVRNMDETKLDIMKIMTNVQFVKIDLDASEDEQQIFDTINSLGVNLTTSELLKNYFFSRDTIAEYESKWEAVFERDDDIKAYWDTELETGRIKRAMIDIFFDAYFQIFIQDKKYQITAEDRIMYDRTEHLAQSYQHFINTYCNGDKNVVIGPMKDYAICFMQNFRPSICGENLPGSFGIERLNVVIFGLKNSTLIPYILYLAKNVYDNDEKNRMYGIIESYIMRRMVVQASIKNYNRMFLSFIFNQVNDADTLLDKLKKAEDASTYVPNDTDLENGFNTSKMVNLQTKGILYLIESSIRPSTSSTVLLGFNNYSLEHLMPKKWRNNWEKCETEQLAAERDSKLLTLGNLAIIPQSLNASIRDANWTVKKAGKGAKPGLDKCAAGLTTMYDVLNKDSWDEDGITDRAKWLYEKAKELWSV